MNEAVLDPRDEKAVELALSARWEEAVKLNTELLSEYPENIDILNRLGRAYAELGSINKAKSSYQKVLDLDPYNSIAENNLKRLSSLTSAEAKRTSSSVINPDIFLEETGKTKVIELEDLAMKTLLASLRTGDSVSLSENKNDVTVISSQGKRIGKLPALWSEILANALSSGSKFSAVIKAVNVTKEPTVSIFVREEKRSTRLPQPIFQSESSNFTPYVREETLGLLSNQEPVPTEGEEGIEEVEIKDIPTEASQNLEEFPSSEKPSDEVYDEENQTGS